MSEVLKTRLFLTTKVTLQFFLSHLNQLHMTLSKKLLDEDPCLDAPFLPFASSFTLNRFIVSYVKNRCPNKYLNKLTAQQMNKNYKHLQYQTCNLKRSKLPLYV